MQHQYTKTQPVKVYCYNYLTKEHEWFNGTLLNIIPAIDTPYRMEVALSNGYELTGYQAVHPSLVKLANA